MRIITGRFRGTKLMTPDGNTTRPTADRTREALFSMLGHGDYRALVKDGHVADICAGSGSVGLEALSRGAAHATFFEMDRHALAALKANITKCRAEKETTVLPIDARKAGKPKQPCDLIFIDPPYHKGLAEQCLESVLNSGWMARDGLVIVQTHPEEPFECPASLEVVDERKYGAARLYFLREPADK
ncbi:16S rRNA (guanine(966)-N(2))-methyltransferase RsmD [Aestuariispira insulae]|uniref:16S rRNA (Guanine966-N2)-methyltransferase n=1 Tax=Aestuariispira insulae TaxID=1461337 RepID=A0A3D9HGA8_9PROT|nr:16S rRNA (guanine(966)-N(2))-methyltransferase RsmD [Aestuariispira insulae]RED48517.1 16S rRNA (guanine966-N2)-methyltransferase [Aestuariispira insulae]